MEVLFRRGGKTATIWNSQVIEENPQSGQIVRITVGADQILYYFLGSMCRLVHGKGKFHSRYLPNDELVDILNLFIERVVRETPTEFYKQISFFKYSIIELIKEMFLRGGNKAFGEVVEGSEIVKELKERIEGCYELLEKGAKHGKGFDISGKNKLKIFYFLDGKWYGIKGNTVWKSPFGWWVTRKSVTKLIPIDFFREVLVWQYGKEVRKSRRGLLFC